MWWALKTAASLDRGARSAVVGVYAPCSSMLLRMRRPVVAQNQSLKTTVSALYRLLSMAWPATVVDASSSTSSGSASGSGSGGNNNNGNATALLSNFDALRRCCETLLDCAENGVLLRSFDSLNAALSERFDAKLNRARDSEGGIASAEELLARMQDIRTSIDDSLQSFMSDVDAKLAVAEQAKKQVTLVHASLVNAHDALKALRSDVDKNVSQADLESTLSNALKMVSAVRA